MPRAALRWCREAGHGFRTPAAALPCSHPRGICSQLASACAPSSGGAVRTLSRYLGQDSSSVTSQRCRQARAYARFDQRRHLKNRAASSSSISPPNTALLQGSALSCSHQLLPKQRHMAQGSNLKQHSLFSTRQQVPASHSCNCFLSLCSVPLSLSDNTLSAPFPDTPTVQSR